MADSRYRSGDGGSALLLSALAGAALGAAGFAWWLLSEADRRRLHQRQQRLLRLSRLQAGLEPLEAPDPKAAAIRPTGAMEGSEDLLQQRVQQLNRAIEEVRRQLEQLQPLP